MSDGPKRTLSGVLAAQGVPVAVGTDLETQLADAFEATLRRYAEMGQIALSEHQFAQIAKSAAVAARHPIANFILAVNQREVIAHATPHEFDRPTVRITPPPGAVKP
jgi:hypothetical protein